MESGVFIVLKAPRLTKDATARSVRKFLDVFYCMKELLLPVTQTGVYVRNRSPRIYGGVSRESY